MAYEFKLPDIGEGVVEGEIVRWLVKEDDVLTLDQPMVEIMTDKATVEIPAPRAGRVVKRMYAEGQTCPVGKVLISIEEAAGSARAPQAKSASPAAVSSPDTGRAPAASVADVSAAPVAARPRPSSGEVVLATPATRKLARDLEVDLAAVSGTGPGGRVTSDDVRAAKNGGAKTNGHTSGQPFSARPSVPGKAQPDVRIPFRGVRKKIAERMTRSKHEAAHFTYVDEVDVTQLVILREKANLRLAEQKIKLSFLPFIVKATVDALKKFPQLNALLDDKAGEIVQRHEYHIGVAAQTEDGLVVPVIRNADQRSIVELAREIERLAAATKGNKATREELTGSTFTITSLGSLGGLLATPIINHPEVAILGVHKISKRPCVAEEGKAEKIVVKDMMNLSISVDHRLVDGYDAARFIAEIKMSLEAPGLLFLDSV